MRRSEPHTFNFPCPEPSPDWYWVRGLHDAAVLSIETFEYPFDYEKFIREKDAYTRNCMTMKIDARGAMFDYTVKEIRFFNYKVLDGSASPDGKKNLLWIGDRLEDHKKYFTLEIDCVDIDARYSYITIKLKFDRAETDRAPAFA